MRNEWDLFVDVHQHLAAGAQVVTYYFDKRLSWPPDAQAGGVVLDDAGNKYHLGGNFTRALDECIRAKFISWGIRLIERTISFGPGSTAYVIGKEATYTIGSDADASIEPA